VARSTAVRDGSVPSPPRRHDSRPMPTGTGASASLYFALGTSNRTGPASQSLRTFVFFIQSTATTSEKWRSSFAAVAAAAEAGTDIFYLDEFLGPVSRHEWDPTRLGRTHQGDSQAIPKRVFGQSNERIADAGAADDPVEAIPHRRRSGRGSFAFRGFRFREDCRDTAANVRCWSFNPYVKNWQERPIELAQQLMAEEDKKTG